MKKLIIALFIVVYTAPEPAVGSSFGPFKMKLQAVEINNGGRRRLKSAISVEAENTVTGRVFRAKGINPTVELPPGHYHIRGRNRDCKLKDLFGYVYSNTKVRLAAICS